ncbi:MAG: 4-hydroxyphenylacetate 3-hydroxylase N-terminal domain-containing protein [Candidatus Binatia bacterium]
MPLKTPAEYKQSLRDGRAVYYRGERVRDVTSHPAIGVAVEHAAIEYALAADPAHRELAVVEGERGAFSRYYQLPRTADDLRQRSQLVAASTRAAGTLVLLVKEIGTDALFALHLAAEAMAGRKWPQYRERVRAYHERCRDGDLAVAVAQTDAKGDRALGPAAQAHPDYYVRIVDERSDGIVVRGAKLHTSAITNTNEVIVLPTRALGAADRAYAVAFALPVDTKGLTVITSPFGGAKKDAFEHPISARHKLTEALAVFDDVFVPKERVFLQGEVEYAGPLALGFVVYHRFTAVSYKLPLLELLVGAARAIAEYNGVDGAGHVREKLTRLATYHSTVAALIAQAAAACTIEPPGLAVPNALLTNIAKYVYASQYHAAVQMVQDIAGALLVTAPGVEDVRSEAIGPLVDKYLGGKAGVPTEHRLRMLNLISDITASDYGGYQEVLAVHAEGSLEAEKLQTYREYDFAGPVAYAKRLAGIG